jgi:hypothetical protein
MMGISRVQGKAAALGIGLAACLSAQPCSAEVKTTGKGIVGGALLGAEVVIITEALLDVREPWIYAASGALGAGAGAVGGYFVEGATRNIPEVSVFMVVGGLGLIIPTLILYADATREFRSEAVPKADLPAEPAANPPEADSGNELSQIYRPAGPSGMALLSFRSGQLSAALPAITVSPVFSPREVQQYSVTQATEVMVPVFGGSF